MSLNTSAIDAIFAEWDHPETPGCVLGVLQSGQLVYERGFGSADLDFGCPLTPNSVLDIGSTAKQFTAACIALLVLNGQLNLDDEIHRWLPELPDYGVPVTVRNLVYHTSGLRDHSMIAILGGLTIEDYQDNRTAFEIACRQKGVNFPPGSAYSYTNTNYLLLAEIIQRLTGKNLRRFADEHLFQPLGMRATLFADDGHEVLKGRAVSYRPGENGHFLRYIRNNHEVGATNLWTNLEDLALWEDNFIHPRLGGQAFIDLMLTPGQLQDGEALAYAFGLILGEHRGLQTVSHAGQWGGFRAELLRFPAQELAVILLTNLETVIPTRLAYQVADVCLGDVQQQAGRLSAVAQGEAITIPLELLQSMAGVYHHPASGETTELFVKNDRLHAESNGRIFRLGALWVQRNGAEFTVLDVPIPIRLVFTWQGGGWQILRSFPGLGEQVFVRLDPPDQDAAALTEFAGEYAHPDLLTAWMVSVQDGHLRVVYGRAEQDMLKPSGKDAFRAPNIQMQFVRDAAGQMNGLCFDTERVRSITLARVRGLAV